MYVQKCIQAINEYYVPRWQRDDKKQVYLMALILEVHKQGSAMFSVSCSWAPTPLITFFGSPLIFLYLSCSPECWCSHTFLLVLASISLLLICPNHISLPFILYRCHIYPLCDKSVLNLSRLKVFCTEGHAVLFFCTEIWASHRIHVHHLNVHLAVCFCWSSKTQLAARRGEISYMS